MRIKKILTTLLISTAALAPFVTLLVIGANERPNTASTQYLMSFNNDIENEAKNKYIQERIAELKQVFDEYSKQNTNFKDLELDYINLKSSLSSSDTNFFLELNKALQGLNPKLKFNMLQRSPTTVNQGFYEKNVDMVTFSWSPDYNDIGTWLTYMFSEYQVANMWPAVSSAINTWNQNKTQQLDFNKTKWIESLVEKLKTISFVDKQNKKVFIVDSNGHALTKSEILHFVSTGISSTSINTLISNGICSWANAIENKVSIGTLNDSDTAINPKNQLYKSYEGGFLIDSQHRYTKSKLTEFLDYLSSFNPNIPYIQDGPDTKETSLVRLGAHIPNNVNSSTNYRDWYYDPKTFPNQNGNFNYIVKGNPFEANPTPFNPTFCKQSNETFFSTIFSPLFSWTTIGDYTKDSLPTFLLVSQGANSAEKDIVVALNEMIKLPTNQNVVKKINGIDVGVEISTTDNKINKYIDIPIRPIPWVDVKGSTEIDANGDGIKKQYYLSPQDYWAGFKGYQTSTLTGINSNNYFIDLINLDIKKTVDYKKNNERNELLPPNKGNNNQNNSSLNQSQNNDVITKEVTTKPFRIYFDSSIQLSGQNIVDILSKQYFNALPAFSKKVQNIVDWNKFKEITGIDLQNADPNKPEENHISPSKVDMSKFYGCGSINKSETWNSLYFASPYYISDVNEQKYTMTLNNSFYEPFKALSNPNTPNQQTFNVTNTTPNQYTQFCIEPTIDGVKVKKFANIFVNYPTAGVQDQITFEQFKTNELDTSAIPQAFKTEVFSTPYLKQQVYEPSTLKVNRSELIPYNIEIFEKNKDGTIILLDNNNNNVTSSYLDKVTTDKYGNLVYPEGIYPKQKSKISDGYYDLIVKNFFTPIDGTDEKGNLLPVLDRSSAIIRTAINDCINWFSMILISSNGNTKVMQNSFLPFGNALMVLDNGIENISENRLKYWTLSAYKTGEKDSKIGFTPGGLIEWTWPQLIESWELKNKK